MSILNKIPEYVVDNNHLRVKAPEIYIDDIFDPLFNKNALAYLNNKYNYGPIGNTLAGYGELLKNTFVGQNDKWGILGPGMGILSTFGRSMDKADDFILGTLTEGTNLLGNTLLGSNIKPENPIENIFVNDQDYTGTRLLASMANSMSNFAGGATVDESDFNGLWNIPGTAIDLATDPGILGSKLSKTFSPNVYKLSRANKLKSSDILKNLGNAKLKSSVGEIGQLLSNYDDLMSKVAMDLTVPGARPLLKKTIGKINELVKAQTATDFVDETIKHTKEESKFFTVDDTTPRSSPPSAYTNITTLDKMLDDLIKKYNLEKDAEIAKVVEDTKDKIAKAVQNPNTQSEIDKFINESLEESKINNRDFKTFLNDYQKKADLELRKTFSNVKGEDIVIGQNRKTKKPVVLEKAGLGYGGRLASNLTNVGDIYATDFSSLYKDPKQRENIRAFLEDELLYKDVYIKDPSKGIEYSLDLSDYIYQNEDGISDLNIDKLLDDIDKGYLLQGGDEDFNAFMRVKDLLNSKFPQDSLKEVGTPVRIYQSRYIDVNNKVGKLLIDEFNNSFKREMLKISDKYDIIFNYYNINKKSKLLYSNNFKNFAQHLDPSTEFKFKSKFDRDGIYDIYKLTTLKGKTDVSTYFTYIDKFINWAKEARKANKPYPPAIENLIDFALDFNKNYMDPIKRIESYTSDTISLSPVNTINTLFKQNPSFFRNPDGTFNVDLFQDIRKNMPSYEVSIQDTDELIDLSSLKLDYTPKDIKDMILIARDAETFKDIFNRKGIHKYIGTTANPTNLRRVVSYLYGEKIPKDLAKQRYKLLMQGKIPLKDITQLLPKTNYIQPEAVKIEASIGDMLDKFNLKTYNTSDVDNLVNDFIQSIKVLPTKEFPKMTLNVTPSATFKYTDLLNSKFPEASQYSDNIKDIGNFIKKYGSVEEIHWFDKINDSFAVNVNNANKNYGITRNKVYQNLEDSAHVKNKKFSKETKNKYFAISDAIHGDVVAGKDYLDNLIRSNGYNITIVKNNKNIIDRIEKAITLNNAKLDPEGNILKFAKVELDDGRIAIATYLNYNDEKLPAKFLKMYKKRPTDLIDVIWEKPNSKNVSMLTSDSNLIELDKFFKDSRATSEELTKMLGFNNLNENYFKHTMVEDKDVSAYLKNVYNKLGINVDLLKEANSYIVNNLNIKGVFGTLPYDRSLRGNFLRYDIGNGKNVFSTNLVDIIRSTYTQGMFDNTNVQTYIDAFVNENFKIKNYMNNIDDLKKILFAEGNTTKYSGNLNNTSLITPVFNDAGKLIRFKEYNKFKDADLEKALKDPNAILIPTQTVAHLDNLLKKNIKMSNKWYAAFNKYIVLPFKFGVLNNPGFVLGNYSDAYFKQAATMSKKYGTSMIEELVNVMDSTRLVHIINNQFDDVYTKYVNYLDDHKKELNIKFRNSASISADPRAKKQFIDFINSKEGMQTLNQNDKAVSSLFMYINNIQNTSIFNSEIDFKLKDKKFKDPEKHFKDPKNIIEAILTGSDNIPGIFSGNVFSDKILNASAGIESTMRSATILNDLTHKGYTLDQIKHILNLDPTVEAKTVKQLNIDMYDAINAMNHSQFNYDAVGTAINAASYVQPFPTFYLKNIAYWLDMLINNPQMIDNIISVQGGLWGGEENKETKKDEFKAEAKGRGAIPFKIGGQKLSKFFKGIYKPSPLNSMFSAFNTLNNPISDLQYRLNPALRLTTSVFMPNEDVKYRPYSTNPYQKNIKKGDPNFNLLEYSIHAINPYERTINTALRTPKKILQGQAQLSDFLPSIFQPDFSKKSYKQKK